MKTHIIMRVRIPLPFQTIKKRDGENGNRRVSVEYMTDR